MVRRLALAALVLAACSSAAQVRPAARTERIGHVTVVGSAEERNAACVSCHREIADEWRASLHRQSASDPVYERAFAREPLAFCTSCHAPEGDPHAPSPAAIALGIACTTCHEQGARAELRTRSCAGCHEFAFPDGHGKMQLTATEHAASARATTTCEGCHMPRERGHASHRFSASRDPDILRRAAWIAASRTADGVVVTFSPRDVGHALPTGDIFRRLRVTVTVPGEDTRRDVTLSRKTKLGEEHDDRPFVDGAPAEVKIAIVAPGRALAWRVAYERVEHPVVEDESEAVVEGAIELASGVLPAP